MRFESSYDLLPLEALRQVGSILKWLGRQVHVRLADGLVVERSPWLLVKNYADVEDLRHLWTERARPSFLCFNRLEIRYKTPEGIQVLHPKSAARRLMDAWELVGGEILDVLTRELGSNLILPEQRQMLDRLGLLPLLIWAYQNPRNWQLPSLNMQQEMTRG